MLEFLGRFEFLQRFLKPERSSAAARNRLQLVLIHDRSKVSPELMESLRIEMIQVISRYMTIDESSVCMELERREGAVALAATIPVLDIRRTLPAESPVLALPPAPPEERSGEMKMPKVERRAQLVRKRRDSLKKRK